MNRPHEGNHTAAHLEVLQSLANNQISDHAFCGCTMRVKVDQYNQNYVTTLKHISLATDRLKEQTVDAETRVFVLEVLRTMSVNNTGSLPYLLHHLIKESYMIPVNLNKDDGIINGMIGYLKLVDYYINVPVRLWLHFQDDLFVGQYRRRHFGSSFPAEVKQNWTPLSRTSQIFMSKQANVSHR